MLFRSLEIIVTAQAGGFSLKEIRQLLPAPGIEQWHKEKLLATLKRKVEEIEALQKRLRQNKAKLLEVIRQAENPSGLSCEQNAELVMKKLTPAARRRAA